MSFTTATATAAVAVVPRKTHVMDGRVDAETVIDELMAQARIGTMGEEDESAEGKSKQHPW